MQQDWINALVGGLVIGFSVSLMLLFNGRVTGISGIVNGVLHPVRGERAWRVLFILGLFLGGLTIRVFQPGVFENTLTTELWTVVAAGFLVGFGTILGSGCTSGHGVCGVSRLSPRSMVATVVFVAFGVVSVFLFKKLGVLP